MHFLCPELQARIFLQVQQWTLWRRRHVACGVEEDNGGIEAELGGWCFGSSSSINIFSRDVGGEAVGSIGAAVCGETSIFHLV